MNMKNENKVGNAFSNQSSIFDNIYDGNPIVNYLRDIIRKEVIERIKPGSKMLELNSGTCTDSIYFASEGFDVTALELSARMVEVSTKKVQDRKLSNKINIINDSFLNVANVEGQFDYIYSNFGGLNCTPKLGYVLQQLMTKLKPGGRVTLTILCPFTLWEKLYYLRGNSKVANRRKYKEICKAHIEGVFFDVWYYKSKDIFQSIGDEIEDVKITGLCILTPPSFIEVFPKGFPRTYRVLKFLDSKIACLPIIRECGDYFMISFTKK